VPGTGSGPYVGHKADGCAVQQFNECFDRMSRMAYGKDGHEISPVQSN
jgi:hypothetical protein